MTSRYRSVFRPDLFAGRTVIVTGGGSGIGRCIAHELASLGAHVVLVGRTAAKLEAVAAEIEEDGGSASTAALDIRDEEAVRTAVAAVVAERGPVYGLVNNAGGQFPAPAEAISRKGFEAVVRTNLLGGFLMAREVYLAAMRDHGGAIVNMLADMWNGMPGMAHSGAARAGMENLTKTLAFEWAKSGVRVNAVAPGWIASSGLDRYEGPARALIPKLAEAVPLRRLGTEAEVSAAVCFLLSEAAAFVTGATLRIDGGAPLGNRIWPIPPHDRSRPFEGFHRASVPKVLQESEG
ncbi:MAG: SDR family oxidoreductase [Deltaproteobacteria bacterium]|nr:MAG: SDR family oxidoreductase [Deltaproteobacteria bacterium]